MTYYVTNDEEHWSVGPYDTREQAIAAGPIEFDLKPGNVYWTGESHAVVDTYAPRAHRVIEEAQDRSFDEGGDVAEEFLSKVPPAAVDELDADLERVWNAWLDKHDLRPKWHTISDVEEHVYDGSDLHVFLLDDTDSVVARSVDDAWDVWCATIGEKREDYDDKDHVWEQKPDDEGLSIWGDDPDWEHADCDCKAKLAEHAAESERQRAMLDKLPDPARAELAMAIRKHPPLYPNGHIVGCRCGAKKKTCGEWAKGGRGFLCSTEY